MGELHPVAASGFEAAAADYERFRPGYPAATLDLLVERLELGPGRHVVDLAAGTGKLTRHLVGTGAEVVAVEPVAGMRRELTRALPGIEVREGAAENIPLADASTDAVTVGQAFHWFDAPRALTDIRRILRPGGWLAVVFNHRDLSTPAQAAVDELLAPHRGDTPSWADHSWRDALREPEGFEPPESIERGHRQVVDADGLVGRVASVSFVAELAPQQRAQVLAEIRGLFDRLQSGGRVTLAYRTELRLLRRRMR